MLNGFTRTALTGRSWLSAVTCGSYPPGKPTDMVAITRTHRSMSSHVYGGGTLTLYVKAQHPGRCSLRYGALGVVQQVTAQTEFTVKP